MTSILNQIPSFKAQFFENLLQKILPVFFITIFFSTVIVALDGYLEHNAWTIGDWLINYQGGGVRRGLIGEIFFQLSCLTNIDPGFLTFVFQVICYAVYFFYSYLLLKKQESLLPYSLIIFSPFIFTFQLNDPLGGFRKEIMCFALLAFLLYSYKSHKYDTFEKVFFATLLLFPFLVLSHEILAILLPYYLIVYFATTQITAKKLAIVFVFILPSVICFFISTYGPAETSQILEILGSIKGQGYGIGRGSIEWLDKSATYGMVCVKYALDVANYLYYLFFLPVCMVAFFPLQRNLNFVFEKKISLVLIFISITGTIFLFIVAMDWGRFIYCHLISLFLISLLGSPQTKTNHGEQKEERSSEHRYENIKISLLLVLFFISYSLLWHLPHCGDPLKNIFSKRTNAYSYFQPYVKTIENIKNGITAP